MANIHTPNSPRNEPVHSAVIGTILTVLRQFQILLGFQNAHFLKWAYHLFQLWGSLWDFILKITRDCGSHLLASTETLDSCSKHEHSSTALPGENTSRAKWSITCHVGTAEYLECGSRYTNLHRWKNCT